MLNIRGMHFRSIKAIKHLLSSKKNHIFGKGSLENAKLKKNLASFKGKNDIRVGEIT